jgi:ribonucleotide reductase alpha subunit
VIDLNHYPVIQAENSNKRHRPIGIGVQGLADAMALLGLPFDSLPGQQLNRDIFETIYFSALTASHELAVKHGPYESFKGSPISQGIFQFDMWNVKPSNRWDWDGLRAKIMKDGIRNSLLVAPMPTASTSQMLSNNECFEPFTSNIYVRRTLAGEFVCVNRYLLHTLIQRGLWSKQIREILIAHNGSVQNIPGMPEDIKRLYPTVWELKLRTQVDMAADRGAFIDQSQSFNVHMTDASVSKLTSLHFYAWKKGLKTGMYYLRSQPAADPIKFTVDAKLIREFQAAVASSSSSSSSSSNGSSNGSGAATLPLAPPIFVRQPSPAPVEDKQFDFKQNTALAQVVFDTKTNGMAAASDTFDKNIKPTPSSTPLTTALSAIPDHIPPLLRKQADLENSGECVFSCGS